MNTAWQQSNQQQAFSTQETLRIRKAFVLQGISGPSMHREAAPNNPRSLQALLSSKLKKTKEPNVVWSDQAPDQVADPESAGQHQDRRR